MAEGHLNILRPLYDPGAPPVFSSVAGVANARFDEYTEGSRHLHDQILSVLDHFAVEYYLFAGAVVGYVRNGRMPLWMDDLDVIIFEDQVDFFEQTVVPHLRECGFNCFPPGRFPGGGYHILGMQVAKRRSATIDLTPMQPVTVPWAQVDVFYTRVDREGFLRNPAEWGLYHVKNVPEDFVRPGRTVMIGGRAFRLFGRFHDDIRLEYGDVMNNVIVRTHREILLRAAGVAWEEVEREIDAFYAHDVDYALPGVPAGALADFSPAGGTYAARAGESLEEIVGGVVASRAATVRLAGAPQVFWAMDLKRLLPTVDVEAVVGSDKDAAAAAHLRAFVDATACADAALAETLGRHLAALGAAGAAGVARVEEAPR